MAGPAIAFAGGGTGGHLVPGLHVLRRLVARGSTPRDVLWLGAGRPVEDRVLASLAEDAGEAPVERVALRLEPAGGGAPSLGGLLVRTLPAMLAARRALRRHRSDLLLGLGGFTTLPAVLAARSLGIPVHLLEINAVGGRATRHLAPLARRVYHAWPSTLPVERGERHVLIGPPLGPAFEAGPASEEEAARAREALGFDPTRPLLLVLGGSQGALGLNRFVREHAGALLSRGLSVLHQCGPGRTSEAPAPAPHLVVAEYLDDVALALRGATLALTRGGASTLAEVAALGCPAIVVPYPYHADRHQERNARLLGEGARVVPESALDGALVDELVRLASTAAAAERARMRNALLTALPSGASEALARSLLS